MCFSRKRLVLVPRSSTVKHIKQFSVALHSSQEAQQPAVLSRPFLVVFHNHHTALNRLSQGPWWEGKWNWRATLEWVDSVLEKIQIKFMKLIKV